MRHNELLDLMRDAKCSSDNIKILRELYEIGKMHLEDSGREVLLDIKIQRGFDYKEIAVGTGLTAKKIENIIEGRERITKLTAEKLSKLGYPWEAFMKGDK